MSSADIVPIALVLDEKTGFTLWAPPWEEDGEEWQAFLGAGDKVLLFESPAQLAQYIRSGAENDLSDHPAWDDITELSVAQLEAEDDYVFDLDGVYDLAARAPDRWSVTELADALDMVARLSECCDEAIVEPIKDVPEIGLLDQGVAAFTGRTGDKAWDRVGMTIAADWESVCTRLAEYLDWREDAKLDEDLADEQAKLDEAKKPIANPDAAISDDSDSDSDESVDDDEDDDAAAEVADSEVAVPAAALSSPDPDIDPDAFAFWEGTGILPVRLTVPREVFGYDEGYTLRCYLDDAPIFLGAEKTPWVFRSPDALIEIIEDPDATDLDPDHDLSSMSSWDELVEGVRDDEQPLAITDEDDADLLAVNEMVHGRQDRDDATIVVVADVLADLAEYAGLDEVTAVLEADGPLATLFEGARNGATASIPVGSDEAAGLISEWQTVLEEVAGAFGWIE